MSTPKIITSGIVHLQHEGQVVTLRAGDAVPEWATVTNPALFLGSPEELTAPAVPAAPAAPAQPTTPAAPATPAGTSADTPPASTEPTAEELREQAKALGLPVRGSKKELAARIAAKLAESAPPATEDAAAAVVTQDDESTEQTRAALEERARALGIEFDENTSDEELEAHLEDQE